MEWKSKITPTPVQPKIGDKKEETWFAIFPRKCGDVWVWLGKYIAVYEFQEFTVPYDQVVHEGIFTEKYRTIYVKCKDWNVIERKLIIK